MIDSHAGYTKLMLAIDEGSFELAKELMVAKTNVNEQNKSGQSALSVAVRNGCTGIVEDLIAFNADINVRNKLGQTPLFIACSHDYEEIVKILLERQADVNIKDSRGWTPLMLACHHNYVKIVKLLLDNNADILAEDSFGKTAIDRAKAPEINKILSIYAQRELEQYSLNIAQGTQSLKGISPAISQKSSKRLMEVHSLTDEQLEILSRRTPVQSPQGTSNLFSQDANSKKGSDDSRNIRSSSSSREVDHLSKDSRPNQLANPFVNSKAKNSSYYDLNGKVAAKTPILGQHKRKENEYNLKPEESTATIPQSSGFKQLKHEPSSFLAKKDRPASPTKLQKKAYNYKTPEKYGVAEHQKDKRLSQQKRNNITEAMSRTQSQIFKGLQRDNTSAINLSRLVATDQPPKELEHNHHYQQGIQITSSKTESARSEEEQHLERNLVKESLKTYAKDYSDCLKTFVKQKLSYALAFEMKKSISQLKMDLQNEAFENYNVLQNELLNSLLVLPDLPMGVKSAISNFKQDTSTCLYEVQQKINESVKEENFMQTFYLPSQELDSLLVNDIDEKYEKAVKGSGSKTEMEVLDCLKQELKLNANSMFGAINEIVTYEFGKMVKQSKVIKDKDVKAPFELLLESIRSCASKLNYEYEISLADKLADEKIPEPIRELPQKTIIEELKALRFETDLETDRHNHIAKLKFETVGCVSIEGKSFIVDTQKQYCKEDTDSEFKTEETQTLTNEQQSQSETKEDKSRSFGTELKDLVNYNTSNNNNTYEDSDIKNIADIPAENLRNQENLHYNNNIVSFFPNSPLLQDFGATLGEKEQSTLSQTAEVGSKLKQEEANEDLNDDKILSNIENINKQLDIALSRKRPSESKLLESTFKKEACLALEDTMCSADVRFSISKELEAEKSKEACEAAQTSTVEKMQVYPFTVPDNSPQYVSQNCTNAFTYERATSSTPQQRKPTNSVRGRFSRNEEIIAVVAAKTCKEEESDPKSKDSAIGRILATAQQLHLYKDSARSPTDSTYGECLQQTESSVSALPESARSPSRVNMLIESVKIRSPLPSKKLIKDKYIVVSPTAHSGIDEDSRKGSLHTENFHMSEMGEVSSRNEESVEEIRFNHEIEEPIENFNTLKDTILSNESDLQKFHALEDITCKLDLFMASKGKFNSPRSVAPDSYHNSPEQTKSTSPAHFQIPPAKKDGSISMISTPPTEQNDYVYKQSTPVGKKESYSKHGNASPISVPFLPKPIPSSQVKVKRLIKNRTPSISTTQFPGADTNEIYFNGRTNDYSIKKQDSLENTLVKGETKNQFLGPQLTESILLEDDQCKSGTQSAIKTNSERDLKAQREPDFAKLSSCSSENSQRQALTQSLLIQDDDGISKDISKALMRSTKLHLEYVLNKEQELKRSRTDSQRSRSSER